MHPIFIYTQWLLLAIAGAAISGIITWSKWNHTYLKWFVIYLCIVTCAVAGGNILVHYKLFEPFKTLNQFVVAFEILFIAWFFYQTASSQKQKKIIIAGSVLYLLSFVLELTMIKSNVYYFQSLSYTVGNLAVLVYIIIFFYELANSNRILNFYRQSTFWIALGMLLFYLGTFPFYGLYNELIKNLNVFEPMAWVSTTLNYFMYIFFSIALLWGKHN